jgi:hypothetical protein
MDKARAANRENRRIILALTSRIPEPPAGTPPDDRGSPTAATVEPERAEEEPHSPVPEASSPNAFSLPTKPRRIGVALLAV